MAIFKCKMCGGSLSLSGGETVAVCEYCGTTQTVPRINDEKIAALYNRANHFRSLGEFDRAMGIYEQILSENSEDAEVYWSLVLCRFGIEYVEDPLTKKRIPTVHRTQLTSVLEDENFQSALKYADTVQREVYEAEANAIDRIQKNILAVSQKEEPFDVFICYKETDEAGSRTLDSVLAQDLYKALTDEGLRVFFARITLEDKLGSVYEPYIFAALKSAKVMVALGTKPEYFHAVWVKNEWSRYLSMIKNGEKKVLIPAYKDMDAYDLPDEFALLQAQDMNKLGYLQDMVRGIVKIVGVKKVSAAPESASVQPLLERAAMFLEDRDFTEAKKYCERVLDMEPKNPKAYLIRLLVERRVINLEELRTCARPFSDSANYQKLLRFADADLLNTLAQINEEITLRSEETRKSEIYEDALRSMKTDTVQGLAFACEDFEKIKGYKDADELIVKCKERAEFLQNDEVYQKGAEALESSFSVADFELAAEFFGKIRGHKDAEEKFVFCQKRIEEIQKEQKLAAERKKKAEEEAMKKADKAAKVLTKIVAAFIGGLFVVLGILMLIKLVIVPSGVYKEAQALLDSGDTYSAAVKFYEAGNYKDAKEQSFALWDKIAERDTVSTGYDNTIALSEDGRVLIIGDNDFDQLEASEWEDIIAVSAGATHVVGLKSDGTVKHEGDWLSVGDWKGIVAVDSGNYHVAALKADGTVVATGKFDYRDKELCDVSEWRDIIAISAGSDITVGLKKDGTVVGAGPEGFVEDLSGWTDIVAIAAGGSHTVGLKKDGTVVVAGPALHGEDKVEAWSDIVAIAAGVNSTFGVKSDGTVLAIGWDYNGHLNVQDWTDIVAVNSGGYHTVGLKKDGTVAYTNPTESDYTARDGIDQWRGIKVPK